MEPGRDDFHGAGRHPRHHAPALEAFMGMMVTMMSMVMGVSAYGTW